LSAWNENFDGVSDKKVYINSLEFSNFVYVKYSSSVNPLTEFLV